MGSFHHITINSIGCDAPAVVNITIAPVHPYFCRLPRLPARRYKRRMRSTTLPLAVLLTALLLGGCSSERLPPPDSGGMIHRQNEGYSLLYKLMTDESDVAKIFIFKHADDSVGNLVRRVAAAAQAAKRQLDEFQKRDPQLIFNADDLPPIEQRSRKIEADKDRDDLLMTSGPEFERNLIFTQAQATGYAASISTAIAEHEQNADRKKFLQDLSKTCLDLNKELMAMLAAKP